MMGWLLTSHNGGTLGMSVPIYTTRPDASGDTASYSLSLWMTILVMVLIWVNIVVWGCIGLYEAARVVL